MGTEEIRKSEVKSADNCLGDNGWFKRAGWTSATTGNPPNPIGTSGSNNSIRQLVIKWDGATIYDGDSSAIQDGGITVDGFKYTPGEYRESADNAGFSDENYFDWPGVHDPCEKWDIIRKPVN